MTDKIDVMNFYYRIPPICNMTEQQLASWKNIAKLEDRIVYLKNGLDIHPSGLIRVDYKVSAIYDTEYEFHKFLHKLKKSKIVET